MRRRPAPDPDWSRLRLEDRIAPGLRLLFVGINPGVRSAQTGHHFAGVSNRFWRLLWESRLVPEPIGYQDDDRLPQWGLGITNLIARPTPGIDTLEPAEYDAGWRLLERKIARYRPAAIAFVGVTIYRAIARYLDGVPPSAACVGKTPHTIHGAPVFVLPNPSGRNAHFSYAEMLAGFRGLRRATQVSTLATRTKRAAARDARERAGGGERAARASHANGARRRSGA